MHDDIQKEVDAFFKLPEKDRKAIEKRVKKETEHWYNKLNVFRNSKSDEDCQGAAPNLDTETVQQEIPFNNQGKTDLRITDFERQSIWKRMSNFLRRFIKTIPIRSKILFYRLEILRRISRNYRLILVLIIVFLLSIYIGRWILAPEMPPVIME